MSKRSKASDGSLSEPVGASADWVKYFTNQLAASRISSAVNDAQDLMFEAWECDDRRRRIALARKALKVSPDCADAYVLLADETAKTPAEAIDLYAQGVAAGERALGPAAFKEDVGKFWGLLETRPYMRAREGLAVMLWEAGRADEAVSHAEAMLRLNPNDNQAVRYMLVSWLQELGKDAEAGLLLRRYKRDDGTEWAWSAALAAFRGQGDSAASRKALARADGANGYVAAFLTGRKKPPEVYTDYITVGGDDEAAVYVERAAKAWEATPGALSWVSTSLAPAAAPKPGRSRGPA